jgi:RNA-binding protein
MDVDQVLLATRAELPRFRAVRSLTNAQIRDLKAQAQRLKATLKIGKEGLSPQFFAALDEVLKHHQLVKVKFDEFKEQKKDLAPQLAEKSGSHLVTRVGNVVVLYRPKPDEEKQG